MESKRDLYLRNAINYSEAINAIFIDKVEKIEYKRYSRLEKKALKKCHDIFEELRKTNTLFEIEDLMLHENPLVRYVAATHCLYSNSVLAEKTLEDLIEKSDVGVIKLSALNSLKPWRNIPWGEDRYK
jgi:hypothetical protein